MDNLRIKRIPMNGDRMAPMNRKVLLVTIYHHSNIEPITSLEDMDSPDYLFLNDAIEDTLIKFNPDSQIFDVCIDDVNPRRYKGWRSKWFYRWIRGR